MKRFTIFTMAAATLLAVLPFFHQPTVASGQDITITVRQDDKPKKQPFTGKRPAVDVAILLDTSNSMDGLINQAKSQLWTIIQEFARAEKAGRTPELRVSVFEYGNTNLPASEGYVRQVCQLTNDLDKVSESLFGLKTNGGDEYCGTVITEALKRLDWSSQTNAYKAIFIAGNEPFTQGSVDYKKACAKAIQSGVVVNTIHCGDYQTGVNGKWKHGAELAEGKYMNINQDRAIVHIKSPQDKIIIELNNELNKTYLWYGAKVERQNLYRNQIAQDKNAQSVKGFQSRVASKAGALYRNEGRDLVDTLAADEKLLTKLKDSALPEEMQRMTLEERTAHIKKMAAKRALLRKKLVDTTKARAAFVSGERRKLAEASPADASTLGDAVSGAVRQQLESSGFELKKDK
jgi:hypothetical protein